MNELMKKLLSLLDFVTSSAPPHRFIPYIIEDIIAMLDELHIAGKITEKIKRLAIGLAIFISDDFEFSESETGTRILAVVNSIAKSE